MERAAAASRSSGRTTLPSQRAGKSWAAPFEPAPCKGVRARWGRSLVLAARHPPFQRRRTERPRPRPWAHVVCRDPKRDAKGRASPQRSLARAALAGRGKMGDRAPEPEDPIPPWQTSLSRCCSQPSPCSAFGPGADRPTTGSVLSHLLKKRPAVSPSKPLRPWAHLTQDAWIFNHLWTWPPRSTPPAPQRPPSPAASPCAFTTNRAA